MLTYHHPQRRWPAWLLACLLALLATIFPPPAHAAAPQPPIRYEGGYLLTGPFRAYYEANGDLATFGPPLTDAFIEPGGLTVQYFTYARFEWRDRVELSHLGRVYAARLPHPAFAWIDASAPIAPDRSYVPESGHTLGGAFRWYWQRHGGVALLGYPISEEFVEAQADGSKRLVQYFERAILRYHPETVGTPGEVRRAPLGAWYAQEVVEPARLTPADPLTVLAEAALPLNPRSSDGRNITLAAARLNGATIPPGSTLSFLSTIGPVTAEAGYRTGSAIVGGRLVGSVVGGGICSVSTLLYRAAWRAGLPVVERTGHSVWLRSYADAPGLEAAVYDPGVDLRIANDTARPIIIEASVAGGALSVRLWGHADGRRVLSGPPAIRPRGDPQRGGAEVINTRHIYAADGALIRAERVVTRYAPLNIPRSRPAELARAGHTPQ